MGLGAEASSQSSWAEFSCPARKPPLCHSSNPLPQFPPIKSCLCAIFQAFPLPSLSRKRTVLVVCGPEQNGAVGLACARHLRVFVSSRGLRQGTELGLGSHWAQEPGRTPSRRHHHRTRFLQEYQPSIFCAARSADALHRDLTTQCEKMDIPFLSFLPAEVSCAHPAPGLACRIADPDPAPARRCGSLTTRTRWWWTPCLALECGRRRRAGPARARWPR